MDKPQLAINEAELRQELVEFFDLGSMETEDQNAVLDKMIEALVKTIFLKTFERLGEEGMAEYEKVVERANGPEDITKFLESRIPGYNVFVKEIVADFKHQMKEAATTNS